MRAKTEFVYFRSRMVFHNSFAQILFGEPYVNRAFYTANGAIFAFVEMLFYKHSSYVIVHQSFLPVRCPSGFNPAKSFCLNASYKVKATEFDRLRLRKFPHMGIRNVFS